MRISDWSSDVCSSDLKLLRSSRRTWSSESRDTGDRAAEDQAVDVVRALIGVDRLQVGRVAHHLEFGADAVAAVHVAGDAGDIQRLAAIVALEQADRPGAPFPFVHPPAHPERVFEAAGDLRSYEYR